MGVILALLRVASIVGESAAPFGVEKGFEGYFVLNLGEIQTCKGRESRNK